MFGNRQLIAESLLSLHLLSDCKFPKVLQQTHDYHEMGLRIVNKNMCVSVRVHVYMKIISKAECL